VAIAFIGEPPDQKPHVNHIDNDGTNNRWTNIEWVNHSGNRMHALKTGRAGKLSHAQVLEIRKNYKLGDGQRALAEKYGIDKTTIGHIYHRKTWRFL
jgi:hypothetical protein